MASRRWSLPSRIRWTVCRDSRTKCDVPSVNGSSSASTAGVINGWRWRILRSPVWIVITTVSGGIEIWLRQMRSLVSSLWLFVKIMNQTVQTNGLRVAPIQQWLFFHLVPKPPPSSACVHHGRVYHGILKSTFDNAGTCQK